jgi:hypothetical protein
VRAPGLAWPYGARMSLADAPLPSSVTAESAAAQAPAPAPPVSSIGPAVPRPPARPLPAGLLARTRPPAPRPDGLSRNAGRLLAATFGIAWILCPAIEPIPTGPIADYPLWQLPIDLAAVASIVAAAVVLWRGGRNGPRLGAAAGVLMAVETIICPLAGHTPLGWWTWAQTGLSLFVLGTSAALMARTGQRAAGAPPAPH